MAATSQAELIILAAPIAKDAYYAESVDDIFDFHVGFANKIRGRDEFLILTDKETYARYVATLGADKVAVAPMPDIWMRDFGTANPVSPVMFRYTAAGQGGGKAGQQEADFVQDILAVLSQEAGLSFQESELLNDGGNFVDDYAGNVVVSKKFLRDNRLTEQEGREALRRLTRARNIAFIEADEQGGLEHADGVVSFVDENTLIINSYPQDRAYVRQLEKDLRRGLPDVVIHEIVTPYDGSRVYDERFGSACGLYTNALVTPNRVYLPQFGIPEDKVALKQVQVITSREIVPVPAHQVCHMGGGVRCMSWQLRDKSAIQLKTHFNGN